MRDPRPGIAWSRRRLERRGDYASWMTSGEWLTRRQAWIKAWIARYGVEPCCVACGGPWSLRRSDLHHRSYDRLGAELFYDLIPLDRTCHDQLHAILESTPAWRRLGRAHATDVIVARLHQATTASKCRPNE